MSWIRSDCALPRHPKTIFLKTLLGIEMDTLIGRLHMLWWWCLEYALDGDLSQKEPKMIEGACQIPLKLLVKAKFVDSRPYRRIHDWWDNQGSYLKSRFKDQPDKWQQIKLLYERKEHQGKHRCNTSSNTTRNPVDVQTYGRTDGTDVRTDVKTSIARAGLGPSGPPAAPNVKIKNYEEAGDNELCGPPKNLSKMLPQKKPGIITD